MQGKQWLLGALVLFLIIESAGYLLWNTLFGVAALFSLLMTPFFFGAWGFAFISSSLSADFNPWVSDVDRMEGPCFNPIYNTWLFQNDRREWAAWTTFWSALAVPLVGIFMYALVFMEIRSSVSWTMTDEFLGLCIGCIYSVILSFCWYNGFWKPRTVEKPRREPSSIEAQWRDRRL